jgi:undecaprenyl diphosphate synthase
MKNKPIIPNHIAIILDGNRRWAKKRGLPSIIGHKKGAERLKEIISYSAEIGVKIFTAYVFSTENWHRSKKEVDYLMKLLVDFIDKYLVEMKEKNIRFKHLGSKDELSDVVKDKIAKTEQETKNNTGMIFCPALNYGGRDELVKAVRKIVKTKIVSEKITEETIAENLYITGVSDPDLLIRTSGEQRLSGFLLWQSAYSELYFTKTLWPDFTPTQLDKAIEEYNNRQRRFGK